MGRPLGRAPHQAIPLRDETIVTRLEIPSQTYAGREVQVIDQVPCENLAEVPFVPSDARFVNGVLQR